MGVPAGPRMALDDGRVVSNFVSQALLGQDLTVYGDGQQTRSFQYIDDLVRGMTKMMDSKCLRFPAANHFPSGEWKERGVWAGGRGCLTACISLCPTCCQITSIQGLSTLATRVSLPCFSLLSL